MKLLPFGDRAVLITDLDPRAVMHLRGHLQTQLPQWLVRPGLDSVLVEANEPGLDILTGVRMGLESFSFETQGELETSGAQHLIPVTYDGEDLADVATAMGVSSEALVALHTSTDWQVSLMGFAPGFGYLTPNRDQEVGFEKVRRLPSPRAKVPEGAVAIAAGMSAIYPASLPGGWRLIGTTRAVLFDPKRESPSLFRPGDRVRFQVASL